MAELGQFYVGQVPAWPLQITVVDPEGNPRDLSSDTYTITMLDPLGAEVPGGIATDVDLSAGQIQYAWPNPSGFTMAGEYLVRTVILGNSGEIDYASDVSVNVHPRVLLYTDLRVTPEEVERYTRVAVGNPEIDAAQFDISLAVARNLHDDITWDSIGSADQQWLKIAIAHQAVTKDESAASETFNASALVGAKAVRTGDVSITYTDGATSGAAALLAPMSALAVRRLSWVGSGTMHATPFLGQPLRPVMAGRMDERYPWTTTKVTRSF